MTFQQLDLLEPIQKALAIEGYSTPTPIQAQSIPHTLKGRDLLGCAQTGTGKTAAFALPILQNLITTSDKRGPERTIRALILTPTRELAIQIGESFTAYGRFIRLRHTVIFGGVSQQKQVESLKRGVDILVATPGRLLDLMQQGFISLRQIDIFVLDEADRMLDMGFI
ncbi:MAG TPA: DEAD/DEAH box helicase, partial [Saprospiraceae bacterium]|nr:DEAD/DEAH box helicase [Saprospiraceae bacterium]